MAPLYAYTEHSILGSSIVSFIGPCNVSLEHMIDMEDKIVSAKIKSDEMVHFIIEFFPNGLLAAVSLQRLLASLIQNWLNENSSKLKKEKLIREGDDLYLIKNKVRKKLSISIASSSAVSSQIHFAVNVTNSGTPVATLSLQDLAIKPVFFAKEIIKLFTEEFNSILEATQKVKPL